MPLTQSKSFLPRYGKRAIDTQSRSFMNLLQSPKTKNAEFQQDIDHAVHLVKRYDPAGFLPGRLLPSQEMRVAYYAVRGFWVETGLRFESTAKVPPNSTPADHLTWWKQGIEELYNDSNEQKSSELPKDFNHPTLRLLNYLLQEEAQFTKCHFDDIILGRSRDLDLKQYPDMQSLKDHAVLSCGSLSQLVLESQGLFQKDHALAHQAAKHVGTCHGLTNALRTSIPVISTTGKLIIPQDLCVKYDVKSPRYLLSALGQGDAKCEQALQNAVRDICEVAKEHLQTARSQREDIIAQSGNEAVSVLIPGLASETFLNRLAQFNYDLTNRDLRHVNALEHGKCAGQMIVASYQHKY